MSSAICFNLDRSKILLFGKGLKLRSCGKELTLPNDKILDSDKSKRFEDDNFAFYQMKKFWR